MSREWKPGDVVTATVKHRENVRLVAGWSKYEPQLRWCEMSPRWGDGDDDECWFMPHDVTDHRRLVAIDPEDREAVDRLDALIDAGLSGKDAPKWSGPADILQAALRDFADPTPPRPDEPTGLGAVVEDEDGSILTRVAANGPRPWATKHGVLFSWGEIDPARIVGSGVQP